MKINRITITLLFSLAATLVMFPGCEVDVAESEWEQEFTTPPVPVIAEILPAQAAVPGVNKITINGQNFGSTAEMNVVYFDKVIAEVIQSSPTSITVHRPTLVSEGCTIKVVSSEALVVAKLGPYRIDPVFEEYGSFLDNVELSVLAVDEFENLYVIESSREIKKVDPSGNKTVYPNTISRQAKDAAIGPDGRIYIPENNRAIDVLDPQTGEVSQWTRLPSGKVVSKGDFDNNGYFYCGGRRSGIVIVAPDDALTVTSHEDFSEDEILALRIYQNYVYSAVWTFNFDAQNPEFAIWRNPIAGSGGVGAKELVLDLSSFVNSDSSPITITGINISSDGKLFISHDNAYPLLVYNLSTQELDYFYKSILPPYIKFFNWGSGNYIYMITGDTEAGATWTVHRADVGISKGQ